MRPVAVAAVALLMLAGCASKSDSSASSSDEAARSSSAPATVDGAPYLGDTTLNGTPLPTAKVGSGPLALTVFFSSKTDVWRVRILANASFRVELVRASIFDVTGFALFPAGQGPRLAPFCGGGMQGNRVWDSRINNTNPGAGALFGDAGSWDLWAWGDTNVAFVSFNGGGEHSPRANRTGAKTGWTNQFVEVANTVQGTAGTTSSFEATLNTSKGALFWAEFSPSNGYPTSASPDGMETMQVEQGKTCASVTATKTPTQSLPGLQFATSLGPGSAKWTGTHSQTAPLLSSGGSGIGMLLKEG